MRLNQRFLSSFMTEKDTQIRYRSECPIARSLDLLGDKWTLVIMRDALFFEKRTFAEFERSSERIPTNLLADRLKKLIESGLLEKVRYQDHPVRFRYEPTRTAQQLKPILRSLKQFGEKHLC